MIGTSLGNYRILDKLGAGGQGTVYKALDTKLGRTVVIKVLPEEFTAKEANLKRFEREARLASSLDHPNICTIFDLNEINGINYIAMQYIEGRNVRELVSGRPLDLQSALSIAIQVTDALAAAHSRGIIHRDIKAGNVMVTDAGQAKVLDFGLAKLLDADAARTSGIHHTDLTELGVPYGTATYAAPEQARGDRVDSRADIFSTGVLLYEMLTGMWPFRGKTAVDVRHAVLHDEPAPLSEMRPGPTPPRLQQILDHALEKDPRARYQKVADLRDDLKSVLREITSGVATPLDEVTAPVAPRHLTSKGPVTRADAVITELAHVRSLVVRPSSAIVKYQGQQVDPLEAGRQLSVDSILTASFLRAGERIRVTAQLLEVRSGEILWSDRIDAKAGDIIGVQDAIEHHIVEGLRLELSPDEQVELAKVGTTNAAASEQYLRGRDCLGQFIYHTIAREHVDAAIEHFKRAVEFDPQFALAHSALGSSYVHRVLKGLGEPGDPEKAETAFNKALALDPKLLEARLHMVFIYMNRGEKEKAREEAASLREEYPSDVGVHFVRGVLARLDGDAERSLRSFERMVRLNPAEQVVASYNRARIFTSQGRYEDALHELDLGAAIEPSHPMIQTFRAWVLYYRGEVGSATRILQQVLEHHPKMDGIRPVLAMCLSAQGRLQEANEQLTAKVKEIATADHDIAYWLASVYALQEEKDEALRWLKIAIRLGNENYRWFKTDPNWTSLHDDPRFKELTGRLEKRFQAGKAN